MFKNSTNWANFPKIREFFEKLRYMVYCGRYFYPIFYEKMPGGFGNDVRDGKFWRTSEGGEGIKKLTKSPENLKILFSMISK